MQGMTLVVREHKLHSAYAAHKHSHDISFTKLCETNQSHSGRCGVVASLCEIELRVYWVRSDACYPTQFGDRLYAC